MGPARAQQETDPLGRPLRGRDYGDDTTVKVPGEIDVQRVRRILEELRRRFGEAFRPQLELDYIERLLKDLDYIGSNLIQTKEGGHVPVIRTNGY
jgi:Domain of unknown function (DUF4175)